MYAGLTMNLLLRSTANCFTPSCQLNIHVENSYDTKYNSSTYHSYIYFFISFVLRE